MAKVLLLVAPEGYQDKEYADTKAALTQANHSTVTTCTADEAHGKFGGKITVDIQIDNVNAGDYNALVIIGGPGVIAIADDPIVLDLVVDFYNAQKIVAAICAAPLILAKAGIINRKKVTCDPSQIDYIRQTGANFTGKLVEVDGNIITANGPESAFEFGKTVAQALGHN